MAIVGTVALAVVVVACSGEDGAADRPDAGDPTPQATIDGPALRTAGSQLLSPAGTLSARPVLPTEPTEAWVAPLTGSAQAVRLDDDVVVVVDGGLDSSDVVALDPTTGAERWRSPLPDQGFFSGLHVLDDVVLATGSARPEGAEQSTGVVTAFDVSDGSVRWERPLVGFDAQAAPTPGGLVLLGPAESGAVPAATDVAVVAPATGEDRWSRRFEDNPIGDGAGIGVGDRHVYVSDGTTLESLDTASGTPGWSVDSPLVGAMTEVGDVVVVGAFADVPDLVGLAIADGAERWRSPVLATEALAYSVATLDDTLVAVTYDAGTTGVVAVDTTTGEAVWDSGGRGVAAGLVGDGPTQVVTTDFADGGTAVDVAVVTLPGGAVTASTRVEGDGQLLVADGAVASVSNERVAAWSLTADGGAPLWEVPLDDGSGVPVFGPTPTEAGDDTLVVGHGATLRRLG